jgi:transcription antitermination factor NusG
MFEPDAQMRWYALQVKPNREATVATILKYKDYEEFVPQYQAVKGSGEARKVSQRNLFPGYVFCRFSPNTRGSTGNGGAVVTTSGVVRIVGVGGAPSPIPDEEIESIKRALVTDLPAEPCPFLSAGKEVTISDGPLRGIRGLLLEVDGRDKLVVSVQILQRSVAVTIPRDWIKPVDQTPSHS